MAATSAHGQTTEGPAFDCSGALSATERAICDDPALSRADVALDGAYQQALGSADAAGHAQIRKAQRRFLAKRNACRADLDCIQTAYQDRMAALGAADGSEEIPLPAGTDPVPFQFDNPIGGYQISGLWFPHASEESVPSGPALFRLRDLASGKIIEVSENAVSLLDPAFAGSGTGEIPVPTAQDLLHLPYSDQDRAVQGKCWESNDTCLSLGESPIDLQDLDFDGNPEVVIAHKGAGQRGGNTYSVYWLAPDEDPSGAGVSGIDLRYGTANPAVFSKIDSLTAFNLTQRQIMVDNSNGACNSSVETYSADGTPPFSLTGYLSNSDDGTGCVTENYRVDTAENGSLRYTLIPSPAN